MISARRFQEAVLLKLLADSTLTGVVGEEIREADYQATNFVYPNVRVSRAEILPSVGGGCPYPVSFTVSVNSQQPSSQECTDIFDIVLQVLERRQLETTSVRSVEITYQGCSPAHRTSVDSWRADAYFSTRAVPRG